MTYSLFDLVFLATPLLAAALALSVWTARAPGADGRRELPGPKRVPFLGNVLKLERPHEQFAAFSKDFGPIFSLKIFSVKFVMVTSVSVARELLETRSGIYSHRAAQKMSELCGFDKGILFQHDPNKLRQGRRLVSIGLAQRELEKYRHVYAEHTVTFLANLLRSPEDFLHHIRRVPVGLTLELAYGYKVKGDDDPVVQRSEEWVDHFASATGVKGFTVNRIPALANLPSWFPGAGFRDTAAQWKKSADEFTLETFGAVKSAVHAGQAVPSVISRILTDSPGAYDDDAIAYSAAQIMTGGVDTTASTLSTFMLAMILHPEVQAKAQEEIDRVVGRDRLPTSSDSDDLPYVWSVVREVIRWHPAVPLLYRTTSEDDVYDGYLIEKGTMVVSNYWAMLHNQEHFPDHRAFRPERWADLELNKHTDPFEIVFGLGRRYVAIYLYEFVTYLLQTLPFGSGGEWSLSIIGVSRAGDDAHTQDEEFAQELRDEHRPLPSQALPRYRTQSDATPSTDPQDGVGLQLLKKAASAQHPVTPLRSSMEGATRSESGYMNDDVKQFLKRHFRGTVRRDCPIVDFIRSVWGVDATHIIQDANHPYTLPADHCKAFIESTWKDDGKRHRGVEARAAVAFTDIWKDLVCQLEQRGVQWGGMSFVNMKDKEVLGSYANFKPDFTQLSEGEWSPVFWEIAFGGGELKKTWWDAAKKLKFKYSHQIDLKKIPASKRKRSDDDDEEYVPDADKPRAQKRLRSSVSLSFALDSEVWGEGHNASELTGHELQLAKYLNEILSHGVRDYASGFLLEDTTMTLWCADRMGLIASTPFDIFKEPHFLLLVVAAHHLGTPHEFGHSHLLDSPFPPNPVAGATEETARASKTKKSSVDLARPVYHDIGLTLPRATPAELPPLGASEEAVSAYDDGTVAPMKDVNFTVSLDEGRQISTAYGTVGRGTIVIPVIPADDVARKLHVASGSRHVAKFSYPLTTREGEDNLIRIVRRKLNEHDQGRQQLKHIVDLLCSFNCKLSDKTLGHPRARLNFVQGVPKSLRRCFRVLVLPEYQPLERIRGPEDLRQIFIDVITGHHWVWKTSRILHCDISYGNIMFYLEKVGDGVIKVIGVLTDWDLAEVKEDTGPEVTEAEMKRRTEGAQQEDSQETGSRGGLASVAEEEVSEAADVQPETETKTIQKARYRTGTGPFMAWDLLHLSVPSHQYRHDLESFFWVLIWFIAVFNPEQPSNLGVVPAWHQSNLINVGHAKQTFLSEVPGYANVMKNVHPSYQGFADKWVKPLRRIFLTSLAASMLERSAVQDCRLELQSPPSPEREETLELIVAQWNTARTTLHNLVTYEAFMKWLKRSPL
ncbi:hypothetical protein EIP91_006103 [Steccherinum ochraceum]|uniref:Fungal-type protein kinase domain-containing protein n=1 Tax=Steccherinum ochraceum TaxID=92696 RepID=A0A4R0R679_9APHY|nr:hypothetical protein EIP91_006103 [Steccherinum ochraceum]